jgi:flagellar biogenesis protein FliO
VAGKRLLAAMAILAAWLAVTGPCAAEETPVTGGDTAPESTPETLPAATEQTPPQTAEGLGIAPRPETTPFDLGSKENESGRLLWESLAATIVILVLGGVSLFVVKRVMPRLGVGRGKRLALMETLSLGSQKSVHLIHVGDRRLLVGASREGVRLLADVTGALPPEHDEKPKKKFVIPDDAAASGRGGRP